MRLCRCRVLGALLLLLPLMVYALMLVTRVPREPLPVVMQERRDAVLGACSGAGPSDALTVSALRSDTERMGYKQLSSDGGRLSAHIIVDDVHKALYCYVPKVACTNWKRLLMILSGSSNKTDPNTIPPTSVHSPNALVRLNAMEPKEIEQRLETYTKFLLVRDPLERTLSAFRNKFEKNYESSAYFKARFGVKIQKMYRKRKKSISATGDGTTFSEFVRYLVTMKKRGETFNEHWAPMVSLCQPCLVRYDMIGKYESLAQDSVTILKEVGAPPGLALPKVKTAKTSTLLAQYLDQLSTELKQDLQRLYAEDILLFGYTYRDDRDERS